MMRKKHKVYQSPTVRIQPLPKTFVTSESVSNLQEQKERFLNHGKTPVFVIQGDTSGVEELASKTNGKIRFDLLGEAEHILHLVKRQYGMGENYLECIYGPRIDQEEANEILFDYIKENSLQESLSVYWSNEMTCSARMVWKGYSFKCNKPEQRRYSLWLNGTAENPYLRRQGLRCLLDHEIGTHFFRSYNDGFQPWFYDRRKFGLRACGSFESLCTEEGLAAINTTLRAKEKYLWLSALVYYAACKSAEMTFKQLFDHLGQFLHNPEQRWKHCMRVKRGLVDPNDLGGYGKDQCYFEGAVAILRNIDIINFNILMSGKICFDEASRVKRCARLGSIYLPAIMRNMETYRKQLKKMAVINGLHLEHPAYGPPRTYLQRLRERQGGAKRHRKVRKRKKLQASLSKVSSTGSEESSATSITSQQEAQSAATCMQSATLSPGRAIVPTSSKVPTCTGFNSKLSSAGDSVDAQIGAGGVTFPDAFRLKADDRTSSFGFDSHSSRGLVSAANIDSATERWIVPTEEVKHGSSISREKLRPKTAKEFRKTSLPPLFESGYESNCITPSSLDAYSKCETSVQRSSSSITFEGLCDALMDSSSVDQLNISESVESWLVSLPPPSPSGIITRELMNSRLSCFSGGAQSPEGAQVFPELSANVSRCSESAGVGPPSPRRLTSGKILHTISEQSSFTQELAVKPALALKSHQTTASIRNK